MSGQRAANKRKVNVWLTDEQRAALKERAQLEGFQTLTEFLVWIAENPEVAKKRPSQKKAKSE
jgi:uncharacterized protein (DUF1778 family)